MLFLTFRCMIFFSFKGENHANNSIFLSCINNNPVVDIVTYLKHIDSYLKTEKGEEGEKAKNYVMEWLS